MNRYLFIFIFFASSCLHAQTVTELVRIGDSLCKKEQFNPAFSLYARAANAGDPGAIIKIGIMIIKGQVTIEDSTEVLQWFGHAASQGYSDGEYYLGVLYDYGIKVHQDYALAYRHYKRAIDIDSNSGALGNLAYMYEKGNHVPENLETAFYLYKRSAEKGEPEGMCQVAACYQYGKGVKQDYLSAIRYYEKAVAGRSVVAMNNLGYMLEKGLGTNANYPRAKELYEQAISIAGDPYAMNNLGRMYEKGLGVVADLYKAQKLYRDGCLLHCDEACYSFGELKKRIR